MYNNDYMYAIERNDDYLAHYGIRGMKWGVRKAIESGNARKLSRQYAKAQKKLAKLEKRANSGSKYAKRAAALGAGAAAAGGLAALGTSGVANITRGAGKFGRNAMVGLGGAMNSLGNVAGRAATAPGKMNPRLRAMLGKSATALKTGGTAVDQAGRSVRRGTSSAAAQLANWGNRNSISNAVGTEVAKAAMRDGIKNGNFHKRTLEGMRASQKISGISNNTIARIGAGAVGAGLAGGAAYNAYRAATTKRAARKAAEFRNEMNKAFAGTKYANGGTGARQGGRKRKRR